MPRQKMLLATSLTVTLFAITPPLARTQAEDAASALTEFILPRDETREVLATGVGANEEGARRDTRRAALEMTVGMLIDAETRLKNNEVIEEIISASAGFIESYEELSSKERDDGLWQVQARVVVRKNLLRKRLVTSKVITEKVDGQSIFSSALSKANNVSATSQIIAKNLADYPLCATKLALSAPPEVLDYEGEEWLVGLSVQISVDLEGWSKSANALRTALKNIASATEVVELGISPGGELRYRGVVVWPIPVAPLGGIVDGDLGGLKGLSTFFGNKKRHSPDEFVLVLPHSPRIGDRCDAFAVPRSLIAEVARLWGRDLDLFIDFKNAEGETIHSHSTPSPAKVGFAISPPGTRKLPGTPEGWVNRINNSPLGEQEGTGRTVLWNDEVAVIPNWLVSYNNIDMAERFVANFALRIQAAVLEETAAIELRLESSEHPWGIMYHPRTDSRDWITVPILPLESEDQGE